MSVHLTHILSGEWFLLNELGRLGDGRFQEGRTLAQVLRQELQLGRPRTQRRLARPRLRQPVRRRTLKVPLQAFVRAAACADAPSCS
jgi:hypothetical protein